MQRRRASTKKKKTEHDAVLDEFEKKDLGADIEASGAGVVVRPKGMATSIKLDPDMVTRLRTKARRRGIGYQTMLKIIVNEHLDDY